MELHAGSRPPKTITLFDGTRLGLGALGFETWDKGWKLAISSQSQPTT
jgi:hypothetical protein